MTVTASAEADVATLSRQSTNLTRSFGLCAVLFVLNLLAPAMLGLPYTTRTAPAALLLSLSMFGAYIWYAVAAGLAARALGEPGWKYAVWILAAPIAAAVLAGIPVFPTLLSASPLSVKFLLGNQLDEAMRRATTTYLHRLD
jgi:hypothetical protein